MATYNICGRECSFYTIPHGILENYKPTPRTFIVAWKCPNPTLNLLLIQLLNSAWEIQAIERPPFLVDDNNRMVFLVENPHPTIFESIERWGRWACGASFIYKCPYRVEKHKELEKFYRDYDDLIFCPNGRGEHPFVGNSPLSKYIEPIPDLYDKDHAPLRTPNN